MYRFTWQYISFFICPQQVSPEPLLVKSTTSQCNTIQDNTMQYHSIQYNTIQYNTTQYNTIQYKMPPMATTDGIAQVRLQYSHTWCMRVCGSLWMAVGFMHVYVPCAGIAFCKHRMPCAGTSLVHLHCLAQALLCIDNWRIAFRRHCFFLC